MRVYVRVAMLRFGLAEIIYVRRGERTNYTESFCLKSFPKISKYTFHRLAPRRMNSTVRN
jgi:hypothetical protein